MTQALPTGLSLAIINTPPTVADWNATALTTAGTLGLPTTTFEPGGVELVIFAVVANMMQQADIAGSVAIQAGFLSFAAFGTVTWTDPTGVSHTIYVTPDPSIPAQNPTGALGWLDVLADGGYNVQRILQAPAAGTQAILNTQALTYGPFAAGTFTTSNPSATGAPTYTNTGALTIPQSATLGTVTGTANSGGAVKLSATGAWTVGQIVFVAGVGGTVEANGAWSISATDGSTYLTLAGSVYAIAWTTGGLIYAPTLATFQATTSGTGSNASAHQVNHPVTSLVGVTVDNYAAWTGSNTEGNASVASRCRLKLQSLSPNGPRGAYQFFALTAITLAPTLVPAKTVSSPITRALVTSSGGIVTVTIANSAGGPSTGTGSDTEAVDAVIQAYAVPLSVTETTQAATNLDVTVLATIWVPMAYTSIVGPVVQLAVNTYLQNVPPGGLSDPSGASNIIPIEGVRGAIQVACAAVAIPVQDLTVTLNAAGANLSVPLTPTPNVPIFNNIATFIAGTDLTVVGY